MIFLIIDDEPAIRKMLRAGLSEPGVEIHEADHGEEGIRLVARTHPDIVFLDLGLPDIDGLEVLKRLREWTTVPVIVLSARGQERDKVAALDLGADDYLTKPFSIIELMARVRVALRHSQKANQPESTTFISGPLKLDYSARTVTLEDQEVRLTQIEYRLLAILAQNAGKVVTHRHLLLDVWGPEFEDSTHTLRVHMANLRQKVEPAQSKTKLIRTETGVGYRLLSE